MMPNATRVSALAQAKACGSLGPQNLLRSLQSRSGLYGGGIPSCPQIARARKSSISRCRGTVVCFDLSARLMYLECLRPSFSRQHPYALRWRIKSRRFTPEPDLGQPSLWAWVACRFQQVAASIEWHPGDWPWRRPVFSLGSKLRVHPPTRRSTICHASEMSLCNSSPYDNYTIAGVRDGTSNLFF